MTAAPKREVDWEAIEREYRAGQLSIREIARRFRCSDTAIRKKAEAESWTRPLAEEVRKAVREKLVREDGSHASSQVSRATDKEIVDGAAERGFAVVISHRRDLQQLHGLKRILAERLSQHLEGVTPDGPCLGERESPGDLLEKLSRVTSRLIPLERQAHSLDAAPEDAAAEAIANITDRDRAKAMAALVAASRRKPEA